MKLVKKVVNEPTYLVELTAGEIEAIAGALASAPNVGINAFILRKKTRECKLDQDGCYSLYVEFLDLMDHQ